MYPVTLSPKKIDVCKEKQKDCTPTLDGFVSGNHIFVSK